MQRRADIGRGGRYGTRICWSLRPLAESNGYQWASTKLISLFTAGSTVSFHAAESWIPAPTVSSWLKAHGTPIWAVGSACFMAVRYGTALTAYEFAHTEVGGQTEPLGE
jgi:hypothetical protein